MSMRTEEIDAVDIFKQAELVDTCIGTFAAVDQEQSLALDKICCRAAESGIEAAADTQELKFVHVEPSKY